MARFLYPPTLYSQGPPVTVPRPLSTTCVALSVDGISVSVYGSNRLMAGIGRNGTMFTVSGKPVRV